MWEECVNSPNRYLSLLNVREEVDFFGGGGSFWGELNPEMWQKRGPTYGRKGAILFIYLSTPHMGKMGLPKKKDL